jgi:hypothetical protein
VTDLPDEDAPALAGSSGDDVSAGTSVSGVGGELLKTEDRESGLEPVDERAAQVGWGRELDSTDVQPPATNDHTGQSEKPPG